MAHSGEQLTERARRFEALVLAHRGAVRSYALRRVPAERVDDVLAETFKLADCSMSRAVSASRLPAARS